MRLGVEGNERHPVWAPLIFLLLLLSACTGMDIPEIYQSFPGKNTGKGSALSSHLRRFEVSGRSFAQLDIPASPPGFLEALIESTIGITDGETEKLVRSVFQGFDQLLLLPEAVDGLLSGNLLSGSGGESLLVLAEARLFRPALAGVLKKGGYARSLVPGGRVGNWQFSLAGDVRLLSIRALGPGLYAVLSSGTAELGKEKLERLLGRGYALSANDTEDFGDDIFPGADGSEFFLLYSSSWPGFVVENSTLVDDDADLSLSLRSRDIDSLWVNVRINAGRQGVAKTMRSSLRVLLAREVGISYPRLSDSQRRDAVRLELDSRTLILSDYPLPVTRLGELYVELKKEEPG